MDDIIDYDEKNNVYDDLNDEYENTLKKFKSFLTPERDIHISEIEARLPEKDFELNRQKQLKEQDKEISLIQRKNEDFKNKNFILRDIHTDDQRISHGRSEKDIQIRNLEIETHILKSLQKTLSLGSINETASEEFKPFVFENVVNRITQSSIVLIVYNSSQSSHSFSVFPLTDKLVESEESPNKTSFILYPPNKTSFILYPPNKTKECDTLHICSGVITKNPFEPVISQKNPFTIHHFHHIGSFETKNVDNIEHIENTDQLQSLKFKLWDGYFFRK